MSGGIDDAQKIIGVANLSLTNASFELNDPIKKSETALGILATVQSVIKEMQETATDIGVDLVAVLEDASEAEKHLTNSSIMQRILGIDQPSSRGHQMFTETATASKVTGELKAHLAEGIEVTTTRKVNTFTRLSTSLEGMGASLDSALNLLKDGQQRNVDAVTAADAFMEII